MNQNTYAPLYTKAKAVVDDWRNRVSLGYEGSWPQMDELAALLDEIDVALAALNELRIALNTENES